MIRTFEDMKASEELCDYCPLEELSTLLPKFNCKENWCEAAYAGYENYESELEEELVLFNADPNCEHKIEAQPSGGIRCVKCNGWFCY